MATHEFTNGVEASDRPLHQYSGLNGIGVLKLLKESGIDTEAVQKSVLEDEINRPNSTLRLAYTAELTSSLNRTINRKKKIVVLPFLIKSFEQTLLQDTYPEYILTFGDGHHGHAFAANMRVCEAAVLYDKIKYNDNQFPTGPYDVNAKELGGKLYTNWSQGKFAIHSCEPVLSSSDLFRRANHLEKVAHVKEFREYVGKFARQVYCNVKSQDCCVKAPYILSSHSIYDVTPEQFGMSMISANAIDAYATFWFPIESATTNKGTFKNSQFHWEIGADRKIRFAFDDRSNGYVHDFDNLKRWHEARSFWVEGVQFVTDVVEVRLDVVFLRILRVTTELVVSGPLPSVEEVVYHQRFKKAKMLRITFMYHDPTHSATRFYGREGIAEKLKTLKTKTIYVEQALWDKLTTHALTMKDGQFIITSLQVYASAVNSQRFTLGGAFHNLLETLSSSDLNDVVIAAYCWTYHNRFTGSQTVSVYTELEQNFRKYINKSSVGRAIMWFRSMAPWTEDFAETKVIDPDFDYIDKDYQKDFNTAMQILSMGYKPVVQTCEGICSVNIVNAETMDTPIDNEFDSYPRVDFKFTEDQVRKTIEKTFEKVIDEVTDESDKQSGYECDTLDFEIEMVPGDGDCGYESVRRIWNRHFGTCLTLQDIKTRFANIDEQMRRLIDSGEQCNGMMLEKFLDEASVSICIHYTNGNRSHKVPIISQFEPIGHVLYTGDGENGHFDVLIHKAFNDRKDPNEKDVGKENDHGDDGSVFEDAVDTPFIVGPEKHSYEDFCKLRSEFFDAKHKIVKTNVGAFRDRCHAKMNSLFEHVPKGVTEVLDLCSAPGGFAFAFDGAPLKRYVMVSKSANIKFYSDLPTVTTPIYADVEDLQKVVDGKFGLVIADGSVDIGQNFDDQEKLNNKLKTVEFAQAVYHLRVGGNLILKTFSTISPEMIRIYANAKSSFKTVLFVKPDHSSSCNLERYMVAKEFKGFHEVEITDADIRECTLWDRRFSTKAYNAMNDVMTQQKSMWDRVKSMTRIGGHTRSVAQVVLPFRVFCATVAGLVFVRCCQKLIRQFIQTQINNKLKKTQLSILKSSEMILGKAGLYSMSYLIGSTKTRPKLWSSGIYNVHGLRPKFCITGERTLPLEMPLKSPDVSEDSDDSDEESEDGYGFRFGDWSIETKKKNQKFLTREQHAKNSFDELKMRTAVAVEYRKSEIEKTWRAYHWKDMHAARDAKNKSVLAIFAISGANDAVIIERDEKTKEFHNWLTGELIEECPMYVYNGKSIVETKNNRCWPALTDNGLKIFPELPMLPNLRSLQFRFDPNRLKSIQGVPGCGKTYEILETCQDGDIILSSAREGRKDIMEKVGTKNVDVMTVDSFFMHRVNTKKPPRCKTVFVDEYLMKHSGFIVAIMAAINADSYICFGDEKQIPYVERIPTLAKELRYCRPESFLEMSEFRNITYRCPHDVAAFMTEIYGREIISKSKVAFSMQVADYVSDLTLPVYNDTTVLTFLQYDKQVIANVLARTAKTNKVMTINEAQGKTLTDVLIVRRNDTKQSQLYSSEEQVLVALTRHTKHCLYLTPDKNDTTSTYIKKFSMTGGGRSMSEEEAAQTLNPMVLEEFFYEPKIYDVNLRYGQVCGFNLRRITPRFDINYFDKVNDQDIASVALCQGIYNEFVPGVAQYDRTYDAQLAFEGTMNLPKFIGKISPNANPFAQRDDAYLVPLIKTSVMPPRTRCQPEELWAMSNRNLDVPAMADSGIDHRLLDELVENFSKMLNRERYNDTCAERVYVSAMTTTTWQHGQKFDVLSMLDRVEGVLGDVDLSKYELSIKTTTKPSMEVEDVFKLPSPQTIAAHPKFVNALFCPIAKIVKEKIMYSLQDKYFMVMDLAPAEVAKKMDLIFPTLVAEKYDSLEADISKYDKSQGLLAVEFDCAVLTMFGVDPELVDLWRTAHCRTTLISYNSKFRAYIDFQRKSGDALTLLGNTVLTMAIMNTTFNMENVVFSVYSGDDSVLWGKNMEKHEPIGFCSHAFNVAVKLIRKKNVHFCSKFLVPVNDCWVFFPDPLKLLTKLGRHDARNYEHLEEYRKSIYDLIGIYNHTSVHHAVALATAERYQVNTDITEFLGSLTNLIRSKTAFADIFFVPEGVVLLKERNFSKLE